jgi:transposase
MLLKNSKKEVPNRNGRRSHFDKLVIQQIVEAIEGGMLRSDVVLQYGVSRSTVSDWMREYSSLAYQASKRGHVSQMQKRSMVRAIEEGRMTVEEAKIAYNVSLTSTIKQWMREAKRENDELVALNRPIMDTKEDNSPRTPDPDKEALERALREAELKIKALNTLIDVAEEQFKIPIRKKPGARQS